MPVFMDSMHRNRKSRFGYAILGIVIQESSFGYAILGNVIQEPPFGYAILGIVICESLFWVGYIAVLYLLYCRLVRACVRIACGHSRVRAYRVRARSQGSRFPLGALSKYAVMSHQ